MKRIYYLFLFYMKSFRNTLATLTLWTTLAALSPAVQAGITEIVEETSIASDVPVFEKSKLMKYEGEKKLKQWESIYVLYMMNALNGKEVGIFIQTQYDLKKMKWYESFSYPWHDGKNFQLFVTSDLKNIPATSDFSTMIVK